MSKETRENPVATLRHHFNMTQEELADRAGLSRLAIIRTEQALYPELSQAIIEAFNETYLDSAEYMENEASNEGHLTDTRDLIADLDIDYENFRRMKIHEFTAEFSMLDVSKLHYYKKFLRDSLATAKLESRPGAILSDRHRRQIKHPFRIFRQELFSYRNQPLSAIQFCLKTGAHPAVLAKLESGDTPMPESIFTICRDVLVMDPYEARALSDLCKAAVK